MTPLRVAIDATPIVSGDTGVARTVERHLHHLADHPEIEWRAFAIGRGSAPPGVRHVPIPLRVVHRTWSLVGRPRARALAGGSVDVVHSMDMVPPPCRQPLIMTLQDVLPIERPELYGDRFVRIARASVAQTHRASLIVTSCESTAERVADVCRVGRDRIVVAPLGRREEIGATEPVVDGPYLLAVGSVTPRKSFEIAIRAQAALGPDAPPLVIAGPDGSQADRARRAIMLADAGNGVRLLGRVDDAELERLYRNATALCHPSIAEGFGVPCLEAMGFGLPVVAADIPSIREMGSGAIELCEPGSVDAFAAGLQRVLGDSDRAAKMVAAGRVRAAEYTWERTTEILVDAYRRAAGDLL